MFGILKPDAKKYLQEKIIIESNDAKRKELLQIYKKLVWLIWVYFLFFNQNLTLLLSKLLFHRTFIYLLELSTK